MTTKATQPQVDFIKAILQHGGYQIPGTKVFGKVEHPVRFKQQTIDACKSRGWVTSEQVGGEVLWTVTTDGRDAAIPPLPAGEKTLALLDELERQRVGAIG